MRRRAQLAARPARPRCSAPLRGNIETRLRKRVDEGYDAVVVAYAALERLGLADEVAEVLDPSVMLPQVAQGALAVECRADDAATRARLAAIDDADAHRAVRAERAFLAELGGGCDLPCGALATIAGGDAIALDALLASLDGHIVLRTRVDGRDPDDVGVAAATRPARRQGRPRAARRRGRRAVTVYLVGAGPGDPGPAHPPRRGAAARAPTSSSTTGSRRPRCSSSRPPAPSSSTSGKAPGRAAMTQEQINDAARRRAGRAGLEVVRLKGGDPFVFGRGGEEAEACIAAGVPFEVVPGITSAIAAPAYAGIPVTHRGVSTSVTIVTGHEDPTKGTHRHRLGRARARAAARSSSSWARAASPTSPTR